MGNGQYFTPRISDKYASGLNVNFYGLDNSSSSGKDEVVTSLVGLGSTIGGLLLSGWVSSKAAKSAGGSSAAGGSTSAQQTQLTPAQQEILSICETYDLAGMQQEITTMDGKIADLNKQVAIQNSYKDLTKNEDYQKNENTIKELEQKYGFGTNSTNNTDLAKNGKEYQKIQTQIDNLTADNNKNNSRLIELKANLGDDGKGESGTLKTSIGQLDTRINELNGLIENKYASPKTEQEKNEKYLAQQEKEQAQNKKTELEKQKNREMAEFTELNQKIKANNDAIKSLQSKDEYTKASDDIKTQYQAYKACLKTKEDFKAKNIGADNEIKQLSEELSQLNSRKLLFTNAMTYETKLTKDKSIYDAKVSDAADKYAEADKNDGNWWKRHMPKWLGGSDKATRDSMKNAHRQKDAAGAQLESYGLDSSDYSLSNQAKQKATTLYDSLNAFQKKNYQQSKAIKYFKENPTATIDDAKRDLQLT